MKFKIFLLLLFSVIISINCSDDNNKCNSQGITYDGIINTIFEEACNNGSCHPGLTGGWGVLADFSSYSNLLPNLENGEIDYRINTENSSLKMPLESWPDRTISQNDLDLLNAWICNGFPEN